MFLVHVMYILSNTNRCLRIIHTNTNISKYKIKLSDHSIYNILHQNKITRKKLRSKYYPEKKEGQEKEDLEVF